MTILPIAGSVSTQKWPAARFQLRFEFGFSRRGGLSLVAFGAAKGG
jgi:hypothetical protein